LFFSLLLLCRRRRRRARLCSRRIATPRRRRFLLPRSTSVRFRVFKLPQQVALLEAIARIDALFHYNAQKKEEKEEEKEERNHPRRQRFARATTANPFCKEERKPNARAKEIERPNRE